MVRLCESNKGIYLELLLYHSRYAERRGIAFQTGQLRSLDGGAPETRNIFIMFHIFHTFEVQDRFRVSRFKTNLSRGLFKTVPGTYVLANIAAIYPALQI